MCITCREDELTQLAIWSFVYILVYSVANRALSHSNENRLPSLVVYPHLLHKI